MRIITKLKYKIKRHKKITAAVVILLISAIVAAVAFGLFDKEEQPPEPVIYRSQLTGEEVPEDVSKRPILGIMIENSEAARPQTGLDSAGIVFETVTEGGITRYLTLFQEDMPEIVGPVRSVRPYFVDWLMGFDVSVAHVGGSAEALEMIDRRKAKTLTQFQYSEPYYRSNDRPAPHNMYARTKDLRELQKELKHKQSEFKEIPRRDDQPSENPDATKIVIDFSTSLYQAEFRYDKKTNTYVRYLAGKPHIDAATEKPIRVKNVIVLKMSGSIIDATGKGAAVIFKNGTAQTARWKMTSHKKRVQLIDSQGNQVPLNRGDSWFAALPRGQSVTY